MKHLFIINPKSGRRQDVASLSSRIDDCCKLNKLDYTIYITAAPLDAAKRVLAEAKTGKPVRAYACGGDGTLNEVINGAVGYNNVSVTHFPCGTGNDFVRMFGPDDTELFKDLDALVNGAPLPLDIIDCNGHYGINICSVGIDARVNAGVSRFSKMPFFTPKAAYYMSLLTTLFEGVASRLTIRYNGREHTGSYTMVTACNGRYYGGGFNPVPQAEPDDGILDFLIVKEVSRLNVASMVGKYSKGRYAELPEIITYYPGSSIEIESEKPIVVNIDGETIEASKLYFKIIKQGVNFIFPRGSRFFASRNALK
jgi:YegS/Rv2252/BmrU family lipid kinase